MLTVDDFTACGWKAALAGADPNSGYDAFHTTFSDAEKRAIDEDRQTDGKVLSLLADACSMRFSPDSFNEPFKPFAVFHDQRSIIPDDLSDDDITFFARVVDEIDDPCPKAHLLKARLADLVWLLQSPRDVKFALAAIDSYRSIPLDTETWVRGGEKCWQRAIGLACMLGSGAGERFAEIEASIIQAFTLVTSQDGFLGYWLADLLKSNALGKDHSTRRSRQSSSLWLTSLTLQVSSTKHANTSKHRPTGLRYLKTMSSQLQ